MLRMVLGKSRPAPWSQSKLAGKISVKVFLLVLMFLIFGCNGKTKEALYSEGMAELSKANHAGAAVLFKSALEKDSNYQEARYQLARTYLAFGKYELAEKEFKKVALQNPSRSDIPLELTRIYITTKKPDLAIQEAEKLSSDSAEVQEMLGIAYALKKKSSEAEGCFLHALKVEPGRVSAKIELAAVYRDRGRTADARKLLLEAIQSDPRNFRSFEMLADLEVAEGHKDKAIGIYEKATQANPSVPSSLYKTGLLLIEKGDLSKAESVATRLSNSFPKSPEGTRLQGLVKFQSANYPDAIPLLQKSISLQPAPEAYYYLGLCYYNQGDLELALSQFRTILDQHPSALQARLLTGIILLKQQRIDDSIAEIKKLLQFDPRFALAHNILGSAYMAKGMYDEGMKELNRALELDPKIVDAHLKKGVFHFKKGQVKEAEIEFQAAVHVAPELLNTRLLLASYYIRQNSYEKALSLLKQGLSGKKTDAVLYNNMAGIMFTQNRQADGLGYLVKAKEADPDYIAAPFNLAILLAASGEYGKAMQEYRGVLAKIPGNVKAMLSMAALLELTGRDSEAFDYYKKAVSTKTGIAYLALAQYHLRKKDSKKAHTVLDEAIAQISRNTEALEMKGRIYVADKKYKDALRVYNEIYSFNPDLGLSHRISVLVTMKDVPKALEEARKYISNKPNLAYGYLLQAAVHESQNDLEQALDSLRNAIRVETGNPRALLALGNLYARKNDRRAATDAYEKALRIDEEFLPAMFAQGALLEASGNRKGAAQKYREILAKSDTFMPAINNLAYIYIDDEKQGNLPEGLRLAFSGFKLAPENPATMDTLGYALVKNGRGNDAVKLLEKAATLLPGDPAVASHLALAYSSQSKGAVSGRPPQNVVRPQVPRK